MAKRKVYKTVKGFAYMIIGCGLMLTLFNSAITVFQRQDEIAVLEKEKKEKSKVKKQVPLRLSKELYDEIAQWAEDEFRSMNGQIEYLLTECVKWRKRSGKKDE